jgi:hypothetical protein
LITPTSNAATGRTFSPQIIPSRGAAVSPDNNQKTVPDPENKSTWVYNYDANGNLTADKNQGIFKLLIIRCLNIVIRYYDNNRLFKYRLINFIGFQLVLRSM